MRVSQSSNCIFQAVAGRREFDTALRARRTASHPQYRELVEALAQSPNLAAPATEFRRIREALRANSDRVRRWEWKEDRAPELLHRASQHRGAFPAPLAGQNSRRCRRQTSAPRWIAQR